MYIKEYINIFNKTALHVIQIESERGNPISTMSHESIVHKLYRIGDVEHRGTFIGCVGKDPMLRTAQP